MGDILARTGRRKAGLFASMPPGRVLDIPAGAGDQSRELARLGHEVLSADLFGGGRQEGGLRVCADANKELPFKSGSFDYVVSREGIEHLENQIGFVRECARVLRPGGRLVVTTPNVMHLAARVSQFLTGQRNLRRGLMNEVQTLRSGHGRRLYHGHAFLIDYFRLRYMLRLCGFEGIEVFTDRYSPTSLALAPLRLAIQAGLRLSAWTAEHRNRRRGRAIPPRELTAEIIRHAASPALLFGKRMIITARRGQMPR